VVIEVKPKKRMESRDIQNDDDFPSIIHATYPLPENETQVTFKKYVDLWEEKKGQLEVEAIEKSIEEARENEGSIKKPLQEMMVDIFGDSSDKLTADFGETCGVSLKEIPALFSKETSDTLLEDKSTPVSIVSATPVEEVKDTGTSQTFVRGTPAPIFIETSESTVEETPAPTPIETFVDETPAAISIQASGPLEKEIPAPISIETSETPVEGVISLSTTHPIAIQSPISGEIPPEPKVEEPGRKLLELYNRESFHFLDEANLSMDDRYSVDLQESEEEEDVRFHTPELEFQEFNVEENQERVRINERSEQKSTPSHTISEGQSCSAETPVSSKISAEHLSVTPSSEDRREFTTLLSQLFHDFEHRFHKKIILKALNMCSGRFPAARALLNANMNTEKMLQSLKPWVFTQDEDDALLGLDPLTKKYVEKIHGTLMTEARTAFLNAKSI
jgi:hypothetical protein